MKYFDLEALCRIARNISYRKISSDSLLMNFLLVAKQNRYRRPWKYFCKTIFIQLSCERILLQIWRHRRRSIRLEWVGNISIPSKPVHAPKMCDVVAGIISMCGSPTSGIRFDEIPTQERGPLMHNKYRDFHSSEVQPTRSRSHIAEPVYENLFCEHCSGAARSVRTCRFGEFRKYFYIYHLYS